MSLDVVVPCDYTHCAAKMVIIFSQFFPLNLTDTSPYMHAYVHMHLTVHATVYLRLCFYKVLALCTPYSNICQFRARVQWRMNPQITQWETILLISI